MSATIKRYSVEFACPVPDTDPVAFDDYVLHADHIASHRYNEKKELAAFDVWFMREFLKYSPQAAIAFEAFKGVYLEGWFACAKSRAKAHGGQQ